MKQLISIYFILTLSADTLFCQTREKIPWEVQAEYVMKNSHYIFEGDVLESACYKANNKGIYTSNIIRVTKIFRNDGKLKSGTVDLITQGGRVGDEIIIMDDRWTSLKKGNGIFFCSLNDSTSIYLRSFPVLDTIKVDNEIRVVPVEIAGIFTDGSDDVHFLDKTFYSKEEFYRFLSKYPNITISQEEIKQPK